MSAPRYVFVSVYPSGAVDEVGDSPYNFEVLPGLAVHCYKLVDPDEGLGNVSGNQGGNEPDPESN